MKKIYIYLAIISALNVSSIANANSYSLRISLNVPVICYIKSINYEIKSKLNLLEFCNTPRGFRVIAKHSSKIGDLAIFNYDGRKSIASPLGFTEVYSSNNASNSNRTLELSGVNKEELKEISLIIIPN